MSYAIRPERKEDYREVENHVETVVLLRGVKTDGHINVDLDVSKLGIKSEKTISLH